MDEQGPVASRPSHTQLDDSNDSTPGGTGYCLLSLDGGGVRGLSTLYILQGIVKGLNDKRKEANLGPKKPCEIFDLIGGTSTGGLIAIMLGRLEMTVEECINAYTRLMEKVFENKVNYSFVSIRGGIQPRFSSQALKDSILDILKERGIPSDERFYNGSVPRCKVFVCTKFERTNTTTRLCSYPKYLTPDLGSTIVEAALATSAAPTYFSSISVQGSKLVDGALGANNPAFEVEEEASDLWCLETGNLQPLVKCFISIGTGHKGIRSVSDRGLKHLIKTLERDATETEATTERFLARWRDHVDKDRCFRFNVDHGLSDIKLAEFKQADLIRDVTYNYLQKRGTFGEVRACVNNLRTKEYSTTSESTNRQQQQAVQRHPSENPHSGQRVTSSEIEEMISLGNMYLKQPSHLSTPDDFKKAHQYFAKALSYTRSDPSNSPKKVLRLCQKLMEASIQLSIAARSAEERKQHADQADEYAQKAVENAHEINDECLLAQAEFMLASARAWKVFVALKARSNSNSMVTPPFVNQARRDDAVVLLEQRLDGLRRFTHLDMEVYETQAHVYLGYLAST